MICLLGCLYSALVSSYLYYGVARRHNVIIKICLLLEAGKVALMCAGALAFVVGACASGANQGGAPIKISQGEAIIAAGMATVIGTVGLEDSGKY